MELSVVAPFRVRVAIRPKPGVPIDQAIADGQRVLDDEGIAAVAYEIVRQDEASLTSPVSAPLPGSLQMASFASDQTGTGLLETLIKAVPTLSRAVIAKQNGDTTLLVAENDSVDGSSGLVDRVGEALAAVGYAGLPLKVASLSANDRRNDLVNSGFVVPRRDTSLVKISEEDEDVFAQRIRRLIDGQTDAVPLLDGHVGARVLATPTLRPPLALSCLLPLYDRVFLQMPAWHRDHADYFEHHFGTSRADFLLYCERGRVVPIFKFNLGCYPGDVVAPWLENFALPLLSPRTFDYIALRHVWRTSPHLRLLRDNPDVAQVLSSFVHASRQGGRASPEVAGTRDLFAWLLQGAEFFEGLAWHRGHTVLANLSQGGPLAHLIAASPRLFKNKELADTAAIETFASVANLACAQAFDASLTEGMLINESILDMVLPLFQDARESLTPGRTATLATLIDSLDLKYSARIPAKEYLDVLDEAETRRIREIAHQLLTDGKTDGATLELRERVRILNEQVSKIERKALETAGVDVVGDMTKVGATAASGSVSLGLKLVGDLLQVPLLKSLGGRAFEALVDDTRAGDALDKLRGSLNRVSPAAIRLYRLRKKLGH